MALVAVFEEKGVNRRKVDMPAQTAPPHTLRDAAAAAAAATAASASASAAAAAAAAASSSASIEARRCMAIWRISMMRLSSSAALPSFSRA